MKRFCLIISLLCACFCYSAQAQIQCATLLSEDYVSDGQYYSTLIKNYETKQCEVTFIEGNEYRVIVCPHKAKKVQMQVVDRDGNVIFDNKKFGYTNYWNFKIKQTLNCTIRLNLVEDNVENDELIVLIGFKK